MKPETTLINGETPKSHKSRTLKKNKMVIFFMRSYEIFFSLIFFSFVVGFIGIGRKIGFWGAFGVSLLLSPIIGFIIALVSKNEEDEAYKEKILTVQQDQQEALKKISVTKTVSIADELEKLKRLREDNMITADEFEKLKNKVINS